MGKPRRISQAGSCSPRSSGENGLSMILVSNLNTVCISNSHLATIEPKQLDDLNKYDLTMFATVSERLKFRGNEIYYDLKGNEIEAKVRDYRRKHPKSIIYIAESKESQE